ncbi:hypothetical protein KFE25_014151 [Diacronema lutheri]|uniref:Uncharacterized protein n=1 Tax=Diacronema lutheri TaxID=2081491 RepID=A0A8J6C5K1_DIALT|nr:hypothetical protein KFE25_014151 [Diacronema lutheri]
MEHPHVWYWPYPAHASYMGYGLRSPGAAHEPEPSMRDIMAFSEVVHGKADRWHTEARDQYQYVASASATPVAYGVPNGHGGAQPGYAAGTPENTTYGPAHGYGYGAHDPYAQYQPQPPPPDVGARDAGGARIGGARGGGSRAASPGADADTRAGPARSLSPRSVARTPGAADRDGGGGGGGSRSGGGARDDSASTAQPGSARRATSTSARAAAARQALPASVPNAERPPWRHSGSATKKCGKKDDASTAATSSRTARASTEARRALSRPRSAERDSAAQRQQQQQSAPAVSFAPDGATRSTTAAGTSRVGVTHHLAGPHGAHAALPRYDAAAYGAGPPAPQHYAQHPHEHPAPVGVDAAAIHARGQFEGQSAPPSASFAPFGTPSQPVALGYGTWPPSTPAAPVGAVALQFHAFQPARMAQLDPRTYRGLPASAMWPIPAAGVRSRRLDNLPR